MADLKIGDTVWVFEINRRVYPRGEKGLHSAPIYREHFMPYEVIGQTSRSWLIGASGGHEICKVSIKDPFGKQRGDGAPRIYDEAGVDDMCWLNDHRYKLMRKIEYQATPAQLREIAKIVGYGDGS